VGNFGRFIVSRARRLAEIERRLAEKTRNCQKKVNKRANTRCLSSFNFPRRSSGMSEDSAKRKSGVSSPNHSSREPSPKSKIAALMIPGVITA